MVNFDTASATCNGLCALVNSRENEVRNSSNYWGETRQDLGFPCYKFYVYQS